MLYIQTLKDLNPKTAEIESTPLIREIKRNNHLPLNGEALKEQFSVFLVSQTDIDALSKAIGLIPGAVEDITALPNSNTEYELINLQRACSALQELAEPLNKNIEYMKKISEWQESSFGELASALNGLQSSKSSEEKKQCLQKMGALFDVLLRNDKEFVFNFWDIVNEAEIARVNFLTKIIDEGLFFHVKLEEHLKRQDFNAIRNRIPAEALEKVELIAGKITEIKKGIERAYESNMRMVNLSVVLYSFVKWMRQ